MVDTLLDINKVLQIQAWNSSWSIDQSWLPFIILGRVDRRWYQSCVCRIAFEEYIFWQLNLFVVQIVKKSMNWLTFLWNLFYIMVEIWYYYVGLDIIKNQIRFTFNPFRIYQFCLVFVWSLEGYQNSFSFVRDCFLLGGTHCPCFVHSHNMLWACILLFSGTHYLWAVARVFTRNCIFVWLLVSNCWQNCQGNWSNLIG